MKRKNILAEVVAKREDNIFLLSKWTDEGIEEMLKRYSEWIHW